MVAPFEQGLSFDDILLKPGYVDFLREQVSLNTRLTRNINLHLPFISSPMDRVTESRMAIALARLGGIGFIHCNMPIERQVREVEMVKAEKLLVGAAISSHEGFEKRAKALVDANVDVLLIDSAHGHSKWVIEATKTVKRLWPDIDLIVGSIATAEAAMALVKAGADALRVGMGPGSICTTRIVSGMGVPQITAIMDVVMALHSMKKTDIPIIADGGIRGSGDIVKALAIGGDCVMLGSLFGGCLESPGEIVELTADRVPSRFKHILQLDQQVYRFKTYRGMGSIGAMQDGLAARTEGEFHGKTAVDMKAMVAEGVEGLVPISGTVEELINLLIGGMRSGFYYTGNRNIADLHRNAKVIQITHASLVESHPHDLIITN